MAARPATRPSARPPASHPPVGRHSLQKLLDAYYSTIHTIQYEQSLAINQPNVTKQWIDLKFERPKVRCEPLLRFNRQ